jgi:hypothetical protein
MIRPSRRHANRYRRNLTLEPLEGRTLMSLGAEVSATVNTRTINAQFDSANASSSNGNSVAVWVDTFSATDHDIRAQRFDAAGNKTGPEILITGSTLDEDEPAVAMDSRGDFVVTWRQRLASGDTNVVARRFGPTGSPLGAVVQVGVGTFKEHDPSVAMDDRGDFVVAYTRDTNNTNPDVFAKRYGPSDQLLSVINVAISATKVESNASVAMSPDGFFEVAWEQRFSTSEHDIFVSDFLNTGALRKTQFISLSSALNERPRIAMNPLHNSVIVWQELNGSTSRILARTKSFGAEGASSAITVASGSFLNSVRVPTVAMKRTTNAFVVGYERSSPLLSVGTHVRVAEVAANGVVTADNDGGARTEPAVSINAANKYLVTYTANDQGNLNIRRRIGTLS